MEFQGISIEMVLDRYLRKKIWRAQYDTEWAFFGQRSEEYFNTLWYEFILCGFNTTIITSSPYHKKSQKKQQSCFCPQSYEAVLKRVFFKPQNDDVSHNSVRSRLLSMNSVRYWGKKICTIEHWHVIQIKSSCTGYLQEQGICLFFFGELHELCLFSFSPRVWALYQETLCLNENFPVWACTGEIGFSRKIPIGVWALYWRD